MMWAVTSTLQAISCSTTVVLLVGFKTREAGVIGSAKKNEQVKLVKRNTCPYSQNTFTFMHVHVHVTHFEGIILVPVHGTRIYTGLDNAHDPINCILHLQYNTCNITVQK